MEQPQLIVITGCSFEEFVAFVFQHEVADEAAHEEPWYFSQKIEIEFDPVEVSEHYIRLFREPEFLRDAYSVPHLDQGFWAIHGAAFDCSEQQLLRERDLPFSLKKQCIQSMFDLFQRLFTLEPLDSAVFMWWDSLCYSWHCGNRKRANGGEDLLMQDLMFEALSRILSLPAEHCQRAALHGLGHLHHPKTAGLIDQYLRENSTLGDDDRNYALAAARFDIL